MKNLTASRRDIVRAIAVGAVAIAATSPAFAKGSHKHMNGHNALGAKLKQNGKHAVGKAGKESVIAEVSNGKVVSMSAGSLPVKKVKSKRKMASLLKQAKVQVAANGDLQFAQAEVYYYGYGFDGGTEEYYYWYPAEDVIVTETWVEYIPA